MSHRISPEGATAHPDEVTATVTVEKYLDRAVDVAALPIPLVKFPGVKRVAPAREWTCKGLQELADEIAPRPAPIFARKEDVPYYVAGSLRDAELTNKRLREERQRKGQSTVGRQRSSAHIGSLGPALLLDDDGDVFARLPRLQMLGVAAIVYSSYSYAFTKNGATQPSASGRVVLLLNRAITAFEYADVWDGINDLLGGGFDVAGRSPAQCYGGHARRAEDAPHRREVLDWERSQCGCTDCTRSLVETRPLGWPFRDECDDAQACSTGGDRAVASHGGCSAAGSISGMGRRCRSLQANHAR